MKAIHIQGGQPLNGDIQIGCAKNAALPLMTAGLLTEHPLTLERVPELADIQTLKQLLAHHGATVENGRQGHVKITAGSITDVTAPYDLVRKMRASVLVLGPILARCGEARVSLPGGCAIGNRPVDLHITGLRQMGAEIDIVGGFIEAKAPKGLTGAQIALTLPSVGATENLMMAATLAKGDTTIINAAREPEIVDLAACLTAMGAKIEGAGTDRITIQGGSTLHAAEHHVISDRIETGTYAIAVAVTGGKALLKAGANGTLDAFWNTLERVGVHCTHVEDGILVDASGLNRPRGVDVMTEPFPGFPTDLQAQFMALMTFADGAAMITETIFENRFMHVPELARMGADITVHNASALVRGQSQLNGAPVMATDLRASSSLVLAGLAAKGETTVHRAYHLYRGYEKMEEKLAACGARIQTIDVDDEA